MFRSTPQSTFQRTADLSLLLLSLVLLLSASRAEALVTISYTSDAGSTPLSVGETFDVDVFATSDGASPLGDVFTSTRWDPRQITLVNATDAPLALFASADAALLRLSNPVRFPNDVTDPIGTLRTVQYASPLGVSVSNAGSTQITRLTFEVLGGGDGAAVIEGFIGDGDVVYDYFPSQPPSQRIAPADFVLGSVTVALVPGPLGPDPSPPSPPPVVVPPPVVTPPPPPPSSGGGGPVAAVPEPSASLLFAVGMAVAATRRRPTT